MRGRVYINWKKENYKSAEDTVYKTDANITQRLFENYF